MIFIKKGGFWFVLSLVLPITVLFLASWLWPVKRSSHLAEENMDDTLVISGKTTEEDEKPSVAVFTGKLPLSSDTDELRSEPVMVEIEVPFTSQAPDGEWEDGRFQDGCEETSVLMAMNWVFSVGLEAETVKNKIKAMSAYEESIIGTYVDTSASATLKILINGFYSYEKAEIITAPAKADLVAVLKQGRIILAPVNGRKMKNPYYTPPGPERHMLVIKGYDQATDEFISNDPGTRRGESFRYPSEIIMGALDDYPTGDGVFDYIDEASIIVVAK